MKTESKILAAAAVAAGVLLLKAKNLGVTGVGATKEEWDIAKVVTTRYRGISKMGNPVYDVVLKNPLGGVWSAQTAGNSALGQDITSAKYKDSYHIFYYKPRKNKIVLEWATEYK